MKNEIYKTRSLVDLLEFERKYQRRRQTESFKCINTMRSKYRSSVRFEIESNPMHLPPKYTMEQTQPLMDAPNKMDSFVSIDCSSDKQKSQNSGYQRWIKPKQTETSFEPFLSDPSMAYSYSIKRGGNKRQDILEENKLLKKALDSTKTFLNMVIHELRNPTT
jgi:hypothetical protein